MDIYKRVENLENLVNNLIEQINDSKFYTNANIDGIRKNVSDFETLSFPAWSANSVDYFPADRVSYNGQYYRCIQQHTSQADWTPDTAVSLWVNISDPTEEFPDWKQPSGAHDAYNKGDKVTHLEKHWISDIDANVYEPSVYGWTEV